MSQEAAGRFSECFPRRRPRGASRWETRTREKDGQHDEEPSRTFVVGQTLSSYQIRDDQDKLADIERLRQVSLVAGDQ